MSGPRRSGCARLLTFALVLIVVVVGVAGYVAERWARSEVVSQTQSTLSQSLGGATTVSVGDRWVLLAIARDRFARIEGSTPQAKLREGRNFLTIDDLRFTARGVTRVRSSGPMKVDDLTASGRVSYAELSRASGVTLASAGGNRVKVTTSIAIWGATFPVTVTARPLLSDGKLSLAEPEATLRGMKIPASLLTPVLDDVTSRATLPSVHGLNYSGLTAATDGVVIALQGSQVELPR